MRDLIAAGPLNEWQAELRQDYPRLLAVHEMYMAGQRAAEDAAHRASLVEALEGPVPVPAVRHLGAPVLGRAPSRWAYLSSRLRSALVRSLR
jgi:hypothetical protein